MSIKSKYASLSKGKKAIAITIACFMIFVIGVGIILGSYGIIYAVVQKEYKIENYTESVAKDTSLNKIHFLSTGSSDCIILESQGHLAMIDCAEDTDNPRGFEELELEGYEQKVIDYVKSNFADANGKVYFDFIIGTHAHSDHIGGFDTLLADKDINVGKVFLKYYVPGLIKEQEVVEWDNEEVYNQMVSAVKARGFELIQDIPTAEMVLGGYTLRLLNTAKPTKVVGENENSLVVYVTDGHKKILLMGDCNYLDGDEQKIAKEIGKVDLLKVGHHGYGYSTGTPFLSKTQPKLAILTNNRSKATVTVLFRLVMNSRTPTYATGDYNGIVAVIGEEIKLYNNIH